MKKRIISLLLTLVMCVGVLPMSALAYTQVKSLDLTITGPSAGMTKDEAKKSMILTAANSDKGDLLAKKALGIHGVTVWNGEFKDNKYFQAGRTYIATLRLAFDLNTGYIASYDAEYATDASRLKVKVNGQDVTVNVSSATYPTIQVPFTIPAAQLSPGEQDAVDQAKKDKFNDRHASLRGFGAGYTMAKADSLWVGKQALDVVVMDDTTVPPQGYTLMRFLNEYYYPDLQERLYITKIIVDFGPELFENSDYGRSALGSDLATVLPNLREVWVSDKADVASLVKGMADGVGKQPMGSVVYHKSSQGFCTADATVYIPASSLASVKAAFPDGKIQVPFTVKVYDGDVYTAQKKGAARDWCTNHVYQAQIMSADRNYRHETCQQDRQWYYSCLYCSKCEYNPNHTFNRDYNTDTPVGKCGHHYQVRTASDEAYAGVNASGEHMFWLSCHFCGKPSNYHQKNVTVEDWKLSGNEATYEQYKQAMLDALAYQESYAAIATETHPGMFTLSAKSTAKVSGWATDGVNHALDNNLLDTALLGSDYTKPISRLQFCSVAVRLAEEMTGKTITPAPANTFVDSSNPYVLKAFASGITTGTSATTFEPNSTLDRQQMATFLYRTIQYIKANSDYRYSAVESRLADYKDNGQIASWARSSLEFMNALDLIIGTSTTTISPLTKCTIEQAVLVAARSLYAHQIGWYQVVSDGEKSGFNNSGNANNSYWRGPAYGTFTIPTSLTNCDRVWITGNRLGNGMTDSMLDANKGYSYYNTYYPTVDPYNGQTFYLKAEWLRPIRN